jgi:aspartyl-tRNA(Asn)/glutamyl-tRNA(Gln) amidotransferase subunit B
MARIPASALRRYLLGGELSTRRCLRRNNQIPTRLCSQRIRAVHTSPDIDAADPSGTNNTIPFRKQLKDEAKSRKSSVQKRSKSDNQRLDNWELTVGIEIHAQLNTARKLFSAAASTINDEPNTHVALFDVAMPGSQPIFQKETLIPAIRAALALNCKVQKSSSFDRKHYFHWDQPSGYQITQYYQPLAKDGYITLYAHDGIAKEDGDEIKIGIKQVQMEQDTAKTITTVEGEHLLDFNRVGLPLLEIITLPQIHYPQTAAALVRKVQILLNAVDACVLGMQSGGLRADVNVSVRRRDGQGEADNEYAGVKGLGQRTEIKNLSSFKAVEDAIIAERDRQIEVLESGGVIEGETRGWTIGSTETKRLRGKEGEVDYRYMPDPDLGPVIVGDDLLQHLQSTLGVLPDKEISILNETYGLTIKDAMSLVSLNEGGRVEYFRNVVDQLVLLSGDEDLRRLGRLAGNWVLHEMGGLASDAGEEENALQMTSEGDCVIPDIQLSSLIHYLDSNQITGKTAKKLLPALFENETKGVMKSVKDMIDEGGLWFIPLSDEQYEELARSVVEAHPHQVEEVLGGSKKGKGKLNFLLGQMMRRDEEGRMDPQRATKVIEEVIEKSRK